MTTWTALGSDPVPGDVFAVRRAAADMSAVGEHVELLVGMLRRIDAETGPAVWRGPASDDFRTSLAAAGPRLTSVASAYQSASTAAVAYSILLALSQEKARRAEQDGERAQEDHRLAQRAFDQAVVDAGSWTAVLRAAELRLADAATRLLTPVAAADPVYHAQLVTWHQQIAEQRSHADDRRAEAQGRRQAAERAMQEADFRLALARGVAADAAAETVRAATEFAHKLGAPVHRPVELRVPGWTRDEPTIVVRPDGSIRLNLGGSKESVLAEKGFSTDAGPVHVDGKVQFGVVDKTVDATIGRNDDGSYGATLGVGGGLYAVKGSLNGRIGTDDLGVEESVSGDVGINGHAGTDIGFGKDGFKAQAGADVFAGAEASAAVTYNLGGVKPKVEVKGRVGIGAAANGKVEMHNGTISIKGKLGLTLGFGGEIDPDIEINVPQVAKNLTNGAKTVEKSLTSVFHI